MPPVDVDDPPLDELDDEEELLELELELLDEVDPDEPKLLDPLLALELDELLEEEDALLPELPELP